MLRLLFTLLALLAISQSRRPPRGSGGGRVTTVDPMTTQQTGGKGTGGKGSNQVTTDVPDTTRVRRPGRAGGSRAARGRGGNQGGTTTTYEPYTSTTTTDYPQTTQGGGKGTGGKGTGGKGGNQGGTTTTDVPETTRGGKGTGGKGTGGKGGNQGTTTTEEPYTSRNPRPRGRKGNNRGGNNQGGGNNGAECANALPQDESYDVLLDALFSNNGELVELGAQALEAYENTMGPNGYNDNVRGVMDDILATLLDYDFPDTLRILLTLQDGTVIYDSAQGDGNTWAASNRPNNADRINENHNSRIAILVAQLSACGVGYEQKLSSSTGNVEYYVAIRVFDQYASFGTVRVSYVADSEEDDTDDDDDTGNNGGNGRRDRNN